MKRQIIYPGAIPMESDLLSTNKNVMVALGHVLQDMIGTSTLFSGLGCVPTSPAGMTVNVNPGRAYSLQSTDAGAYSSLLADATPLVKQGILLTAQNFSCPAPTTAGYSINYLVQGAFQEVDAGSTVLPYYNASNPAQAYSGPNGTGTSNNTYRDNTVQLSLKAGVAATTGAQITPTPDAGFTGLWVITVPYGATTITSGNISQYSGAPFLGQPLLTQIQSAPNGVVGQVRNLAMSAAAGATTATLTADEIMVETALGGQVCKLASFSKTINLATTGAGGMDVGTATASGFLGIYAIYNPTTGASALLGKMESGAALPSVYAGANMPSGYSASGLVCVVPISGTTGQFAAFNMMDRKVQVVAATVYSNSSASSIPLTSITTAAVPYSAKRFQGSLSLTNSASGSAIFSFYGDANACGVIQFSLNTQTAGGNLFGISNIEMATPRTVRFATSINGGSPSFQTILSISGYEF